MCCSVLQCVAVCCSELQCVAVSCCVVYFCKISMLQCVAVCCSALLCVAVCCSVFTHTKCEARHTHVTHTHTHTHTGEPVIQAHIHTSHARHTHVKANVTYILRVSNEVFVLQHTTHCNTLQRTATHCTSHTLHTRVTSKCNVHHSCVE